MDISTMNIKDLKALAYDVSVNMQQSQQYLIAINQEIQKKQQTQSKEIIDDAKIDIKENK